MRDIKNWRREVQDKETWRKAINKEVKSTTVRSDAVHVMHEHQERAKNVGQMRNFLIVIKK
jgi:hypothetical protein